MTEVERLKDALRRIRRMTDADDPDSYRCDDREGCLDAVFGVASEALAPESPVSENDG